MTRERQAQDAFLDALEHARALLEAGMSVDGALGDAPPALRTELAEALRALARVEGALSPHTAPSAAFASVLAHRLQAAVEDARVARTSRRPFWAGPLLWRLGAAAAAVVLALGVSGFAAVQASTRTIPGDPLYTVKEARETVQVFFARGDDRVARAHLDRLAARQRELELALERGAPADVVITLEKGVASAVNQIVRASMRLERAGEPRAAELASMALIALRARIDALAAAEDSPAIAVTLRRMSNFLDGQERALRGEPPPAPEQRPELSPTEVRPLREPTAAPVRTRPASTPTPTPTPLRVRPQ